MRHSTPLIPRTSVLQTQGPHACAELHGDCNEVIKWTTMQHAHVGNVAVVYNVMHHAMTRARPVLSLCSR